MVESNMQESGSNSGRAEVVVASEREEIVFGERLDWHGRKMATGIAKFTSHESSYGDPITVARATKLIEKNYLSPHDQQHNSPTARELVRFCDAIHQGYGRDIVEARLIGYVVSPHREDARVSLEGFIVEADQLPAPLQAELLDPPSEFKGASNRTVDDSFARFWWD